MLIFGVVARHRRAFLAGALVLAVVAGLVVQADWLNIFVVLFGLGLPLITLSALAARRYRPATMTVRSAPPAFATETNLPAVFLAAAFMIMVGCLVVEDITDIVDGEELWAMNVVTAGLWTLVVGLHLYGALGTFGVRLSPAGFHDRQLLGSLFVPWEAFAPGYPAVPVRSNALTLYYERPDLVRRRGLWAGLQTGTDAAFLAQAIHQYVAHPEHRQAIGTEAELRRLTARIAA